MNECEFSTYLIRKGTSLKICSDIISRLKRIEKSIKDCDLDDEYQKDKCTSLLMLFNNKGMNDEMKKVHVGTLPIGSYTLSTFRYAIRKYISFKEERT